MIERRVPHGGRFISSEYQKDFPFYEDLYTQHFASINGINFTRREIDVIACLLNARGTSKIASFLSIALRTVITHTRNIMRKIDCNSREGIIDFVEKDNRVAFLRDYYASLVAESAFKKALKEIGKLTYEKGPHHLLIYGQNQKLKQALEQRLSPHLSHIGMAVEIQDTLLKPQAAQQHTLVLVFLEKELSQSIPQECASFESVDLAEVHTYYAAVFEILKKSHPHANMEEAIKNFWEKIKGSFSSGEYKMANTYLEDSSPIGSFEKRSVLTYEPLFTSRRFALRYAQKLCMRDQAAILSALIV